MNRLAILFIASMSWSWCLRAQDRADTAFYQSAVHQALAVSQQKLGEITNIYTGREYQFISNGIKGSPFFGNPSPSPADIVYNGTTYRGVAATYDLAEDLLFITDPGMGFNITLQSEKVREFRLQGHHFIRIGPESAGSGLPKSGYYDLLLDGPVRVLAKRAKKVQLSYRFEDTTKYISSDQYYIFRDNAYYQVDGRNSLYAAFADQKDAVKKYFRKSGLDFNADPEKALIETAEYYLQIKK